MLWYLTRHGKTDFNEQERVTGLREARLTQKGVQDAILIGQLVKNVKPEKVLISQKFRALQTGLIAARAAGYEKKLITEPLLDEVYFGRAEGRLLKEVEGLSVLNHYDPRYMNDGPVRRKLVKWYGVEDLHSIEGTVRALARQAEWDNGAYVSVGHSLKNAYVVEFFKYRTVGKNIGMSIFPQRHDQVSVIETKGKEVLRVEANVPIEDIVGTTAVIKDKILAEMAQWSMAYGKPLTAKAYG